MNLDESSNQHEQATMAADDGEVIGKHPALTRESGEPWYCQKAYGGHELSSLPWCRPEPVDKAGR